MVSDHKAKAPITKHGKRRLPVTADATSVTSPFFAVT